MLLTTVPRRRAGRYTWRWWWQGDGTNEGNPGWPSSSATCNRPQNKWQPKSFQVSVTKYKSSPPHPQWYFGVWGCVAKKPEHISCSWSGRSLNWTALSLRCSAAGLAAVAAVAAEGPSSWRPHQLQLFTTYAKRVQLRALTCGWSRGCFWGTALVTIRPLCLSLKIPRLFGGLGKSI